MSTVDTSLGLFCLGVAAFTVVVSLSGNVKSDFGIFMGEIALALIVACAVAFLWTALSTCLDVFRQTSNVGFSRVLVANFVGAAVLIALLVWTDWIGAWRSEQMGGELAALSICVVVTAIVISRLKLLVYGFLHLEFARPIVTAAIPSVVTIILPLTAYAAYLVAMGKAFKN